ncbi:MAG: PEP-CTERM sorting domain-containing protein [Planctomycetes bacterium]|nr:PEP-CTERM sorting domain-containing protein [Planctomycetota bacterium]
MPREARWAQRMEDLRRGADVSRPRQERVRHRRRRRHRRVRLLVQVIPRRSRPRNVSITPLRRAVCNGCAGDVHCASVPRRFLKLIVQKICRASGVGYVPCTDPTTFTPKEDEPMKTSRNMMRLMLLGGVMMVAMSATNAHAFFFEEEPSDPPPTPHCQPPVTDDTCHRHHRRCDPPQQPGDNDPPQCFQHHLPDCNLPPVCEEPHNPPCDMVPPGTTPVPEPASLALVGLGAAVMLSRRARKGSN